MKKFVYRFEPNGKDFFLKAKSLKEAKATLESTFGKVHSVVETINKRSVKSVSMFDYELSLLN